MNLVFSFIGMNIFNSCMHLTSMFAHAMLLASVWTRFMCVWIQPNSTFRSSDIFTWCTSNDVNNCLHLHEFKHGSRKRQLLKLSWVWGVWVGGGLRSLPTCTLAPHEASPCHLNLHHCQHLCHAWSEDSEFQSINCQFALSSHAHNLRTTIRNTAHTLLTQ